MDYQISMATPDTAITKLSQEENSLKRGEAFFFVKIIVAKPAWKIIVKNETKEAFFPHKINSYKNRMLNDWISKIAIQLTGKKIWFRIAVLHFLPH